MIASYSTLTINKVTSEKIEFLHELPFNSQILRMLRIPPTQSAGKNANLDLLFILTSDYQCALLGYNCQTGVCCLSQGNLTDQFGQRKFATPSVFLSPDASLICMHLYENQIKILPLVKQRQKVVLGSSINLRLRVNDVRQVLPLYGEGDMQILVLYDQTVHKQLTPDKEESELVSKVKRIRLNLESKELVENMEGSFRMGGGGVYLLHTLEFGGFLAFETSMVYFFRDLEKGNFAKGQLRNEQLVKAICPIDSVAGNNGLIRYLIGTQQGELYLLGFYTAFMNSKNDFHNSLVIQFIGACLPDCSNLHYISTGLVYYSSQLGESLILRLQTEKQLDGHPLQPYITVAQRFHSLGCINNLLVRNKSESHSQSLSQATDFGSQQLEMIVSGGEGHSSKLSRIQKGVNLTRETVIEGLPELEDGPSLFLVFGMLAVKCRGLDTPLFFSLPSFAQIECPCLSLPSPFLLLLISECLLSPQEEAIALVHSTGIEVISKDLAMCLGQWQCPAGLEIADACTSKDKVLLAIRDELWLLEEAVKLATKKKMKARVAAVQISGQFLVAQLGDAPVFSLLLMTMEMDVLCMVSVSYCVNSYQFLRFKLNEDLKTNASQKGHEQMSIEDDCYDPMATLNSDFALTCVTSIKCVQRSEQHYIFCGLSNGQVLSLCLDLQIAHQLKKDLTQQIYPEQCTSKKDLPPAVWNFKVFALGQGPVSLVKLASSDKALSDEKAGSGDISIFALGERPAHFSMQRQQAVVMKHVGERNLRQLVQLKGCKVLGERVAFEDAKGKLVIGKLETSSNIQMEQFQAPGQVLKMKEMGENIVALIELPHFSFMNTDEDMVNSVVMFNDKFETISSFPLKKFELPKSIFTFQSLVFVGTMMISLEETIPSRGRLLVFEVNNSHLELKHSEAMIGSVQGIQLLMPLSHLVLAINGEIYFYQVNGLDNPEKLGMKHLLTRNHGFFISELQAVCQSGKWSLLVSDTLKGFMIYDWQVSRAHHLPQLHLEEGPSFGMRVTAFDGGVVPLGKGQLALADSEKNLWVLQRAIEPRNDRERFRLQPMAYYRIGEQVSTAIPAHFHSNQGSCIPNDFSGDDFEFTRSQDSQPTAHKEKRIANSLDSSQHEPNSLDPSSSSASFRSSSDHEDFIALDLRRLKSDKEYARVAVKKAVEQMERSVGRDVLLGTTEGSLQAMVEVPQGVYMILEQLQTLMEEDPIFEDVFKKSRHGLRHIRIDEALQRGYGSKNMLDGDFLEQFLEMEPKKQFGLVSQFMYTQKKQGQEVVDHVKHLIESLKERH